MARNRRIRIRMLMPYRYGVNHNGEEIETSQRQDTSAISFRTIMHHRVCLQQ